MRQVLFELPYIHVKVFGFGTMLFVAFLAAMYLAAWRARREKLDPDVIYDLAFWMILGGLAGARLFYVWQYWGVDQIQTFWDIFKIWTGGIVYYGSIMGGAIAFFVYWSIRRFPLRPTLDTVAPALALGTAIGRLGCFLNGCCFGDRCELPWAVRFPFKTAPWWDHYNHGWVSGTSSWSLRVHPTQLYSAFDGLVLLALLTTYYPVRRRDGEVMALMMVTYPITRFLIEYLRADEAVFFAGMTISQTISVATFLGGVAFWIALLRSPAGRYADTAVAPSVPAAT